MFGIDPLYIAMILPVLLFSMWASVKVKSSFSKYSKIPASSGMTGKDTAEYILRANGLAHVKVVKASGFLSDHYDPTRKVLRLSPDVYRGNSLSAVGVACHEAGHALQHANSYGPLMLRTALVPVTSISSSLAFYVVAAGFLFRPLLLVGCAMFAVAFLFSLVTLPVEWNASARAKQHLVTSGIVSPGQEAEAGRVLNAAFLTYLAAAVSSLITLLYYLARAGVIGGGRRD